MVKLNSLLDPKWVKNVRFLELTEKSRSLTVGDGTNCIGVAERLPSERVLEFAIANNIPHVVQSSNLGFNLELNSAALMIENHELFFSFPISSIFAPSYAGQEKEVEFLKYERFFSSSDEKDQILNDVDACIQTMAPLKTIREDAILILDELFTNALYNAPFVDEGNLSVGASRFGGGVSMGPDRQGRIFLGCDGERILIGCTDPFGRLNIPALMRRIENCFKVGVEQSIRSDNAGGAGIGSFMVYQTCASYYVAVKKGRQTTICGMLPMAVSNRVRSQYPKNIHLLDL